MSEEGNHCFSAVVHVTATPFASKNKTPDSNEPVATRGPAQMK